MNKAYKTIRKWAKLRHPDKEFGKTAIKFYNTLDERDRNAMLKEFQDYIDQVQSGQIEPSPVELHIPKFKKNE